MGPCEPPRGIYTVKGTEIDGDCGGDFEQLVNVSPGGSFTEGCFGSVELFDEGCSFSSALECELEDLRGVLVGQGRVLTAAEAVETDGSHWEGKSTITIDEFDVGICVATYDVTYRRGS